MTRRIIQLLTLVPFLASGCLAIEKKSQVLIIPPDSKKVYIYWVYEGISVLERQNKEESNLENAKRDLDDLKKPGFPSGGDDKNPLLKHCRFEETRFFVNPDRKRQLCMDRRVTVLDREAFVKTLNKSTSETISKFFEENDSQKVLADIKELNEKGGQEGLVKLANELDLASIQRIKAYAEKEFRWVRFEPESVRIVIPATPDCAKRIVGDTKTKDRLKEMRVEPIELVATEEGLVFVLGGKEKVIRMTSANSNPYRASEERALIEHVGSPKALLINGKNATAELLIEQFVTEKTKKR